MGPLTGEVLKVSMSIGADSSMLGGAVEHTWSAFMPQWTLVDPRKIQFDSHEYSGT